MQELDEIIDEWHTSNILVPLWQFLKLTKQEYARWVECKMSDEEVIKLYKERK